MQIKDFIILKLQETIKREEDILNDEKLKLEKQKCYFFPAILSSLRKGFICSFVVEFTVFMIALYLSSFISTFLVSILLCGKLDMGFILHFSSILFLFLSIICFLIPDQTTTESLYYFQKKKIKMANKTLKKIKKGKQINNLNDLFPLFLNQIATQQDLEFALKYITEKEFTSLLENNNKVELFDLIDKLTENIPEFN